MMLLHSSLVGFLVLFSTLAMPQQQNPAPPLYPAPNNPAEQQSRENLAAQENSQTPVFRVSVYARSAQAVNYRNRGGSTAVSFKGTELMPNIGGHSKIDGKAGRLASMPTSITWTLPRR